MKCFKCGFDVPEGKKFCMNCGTKMDLGTTGQVEKAVVNKCPSCGRDITPGKKFCMSCGAKLINDIKEPEKNETELAQSAGFIHWNILPGQLAVKIDEQDILNYKDVKGFVVQDGTKALFFADGAFAGELTGGKYPFKEMGISAEKSVKGFFRRIANFFTGRGANLIENAASIVIVIIRDANFPLIFTESDMPTAGIRTEVAVQAVAKITNILQFYQNLLLDSKFVTFEKIGNSLQSIVRTALEDAVTGLDPESISVNSQLRDKLKNSLQVAVATVYPYISIENVIRLTATNSELEELRHMKEELYISERQLIELNRRNDFLNRLNDEKNQQLLREAQSEADFAIAMNKIDEQNQLTEDEKAKFADMLYWQRRLREAKNEDEGNAALAQLEKNGLLREEELSVLKVDIEQRRKMRELTDGQALAMLTMQNEMALDAQKLQWEIEIGNKRFQNEMEQQRVKDEYADARRRSTIDLDKEEMMAQLEVARQAQALRQEREDNEHRRMMEELNSAREHERSMAEDKYQHEEEMRRMFQNMSAEQIMAANPDITPEAAAALAEKYKSVNAQAQIDMANKHSEDIERIMAANSAQQQANMTQMMTMMAQMFGSQNDKKQAEVDAIRRDANDHQDRMTDIIKTQANAAYGAAGKIFSIPAKQVVNNNTIRKEMVSKCPNCGATLDDGASFCGECGNSL